jgi:hypothetical protein
MRKLLMSLAFVLVIMSGCIYIQVFPDAPGSDKAQPPPTATFNAIPDIGPATSNQPVVGPLTITPQGERVAVLSLILAESGSMIKSSASYVKSSAVCAGDNAANLASRAFLGFDLTSLPPAAIISEAVLDFTGNTALGNPTYSNANWGNMGAMEVYQYQYGSLEDAGRIAYESTTSSAGSLKLTDIANSPLQLDVTTDGAGNNVVQQLMNNAQSRCQFRVQFFTSTNWDSKADQLCLEGAVLRVKYTLP